jgi:protoheme ferro-lyase
MDKDAKKLNCWEYMDCSDKNCVVFQNKFGHECWLLMKTKNECHAAKKYGDCFKCPFYLLNNTK